MTKPIAFACICALVTAAGAVVAQQQEVRVETTIAGRPMVGGSISPMGAGSGVIFGQVTEADSNRPVAGAIVTLSIPGVQPIRVMADPQGRFGFRDLPRGNFSISTTRPGWLDGAYGRTRPAGPGLSLTLGEGEKASNVTVAMWRYAAITGTLIDENGDPIVNKPVRVLRRTTSGGKVRLVAGPQDSTDDRGMYRIGMLEPGDYIVAVPLEQSAFMGDLPLEAPAMAAREMVVAARASAVGGGGGAMTFVEASGPGTPAGMTEDGRLLVFPTMFYPTATSAVRATLITVGSGDERAGIDFQLKAVTAARVSGTMMGPDGPAPNLQINMVPADSDDLPSTIETLTGFTDGQGRFTINGVTPGQYILRAVRMPRMAMGPSETQTFQQGGNVMVIRSAVANTSAPLPTDPTLWAEMNVSVGSRDLPDLTVGLRPGVKVTGLVQFNGATERPAGDRLPGINLFLEPAEVRPGLSQGRGRIESSGQFSTVGVPPGRYFIRVAGAPQGWTFHSAMVAGRDASVTPIEIEGNDIGGVSVVFTDRPSELSGDVSVQNGTPDAISVLVFPTDSSAWTGYGSSARKLAITRVSKDGKYRLTNLPAGEYFVAAIPDRLASDWQNPKFLESLATEASRVRVRDADTVTLSLRVTR